MLVDPDGKSISETSSRCCRGCHLGKKNLGTRIDMAKIVIGLGPGFEAGKDVHAVVETKRGHSLGCCIL